MRKLVCFLIGLALTFVLIGSFHWYTLLVQKYPDQGFFIAIAFCVLFAAYSIGKLVDLSEVLR